eukprot:c20755_g1_i1.p1 GENE.c20755_g1_i1~~c20755_g1_i1.p1  ORF type:complete len:1055 (+),score=441.22 c20755_g1_i1:44-3208(+)
MDNETKNRLFEWIVATLAQHNYDGDITALSTSVLSYIGNQNEVDDLEEILIEKLTPTLKNETKSFVSKLIQTLSTKSYLSQSSKTSSDNENDYNNRRKSDNDDDDTTSNKGAASPIPPPSPSSNLDTTQKSKFAKLFNFYDEKEPSKKPTKMKIFQNIFELYEKLRYQEDEPKLTIGICAMEKKANGKPMLAILGRIERFKRFNFVKFGDECILNKSIEEWPICDILISFFSSGFPLQKAIDYVKLRKPFCFNDLEKSSILLDRRKVYKVLLDSSVPVVRYAVCERDENNNLITPFEEEEDAVIVGNIKIKKPFVEKPIDAEDHNIYIYYPSSVGGGCKTMFRKVSDRSSSFFPDVNRVRTQGSYIYEEYAPTEGYDIKVYTVGVSYAHAEARKSPSLDGKVERREDGKEQRYPIMLSMQEKAIANKIVTNFGQNVCGFDILRSGGVSYVCDVNGWSFVKGSEKYYDDAASLLGVMMLTQFNRKIPDMIQTPRESNNAPLLGSAVSQNELRCVVGIFRHGDRTPKQKIKITVTDAKAIEFFNAKGGTAKKEVKLKSATDLATILTMVSEWIERPNDFDEESIEGFKHVKMVLTQDGSFRGINRKVQLKPVSSDQSNQISTVLLILKWGGVLTELGMQQSEQLGHNFRFQMYNPERGGLLRLHSTMRHDLKIYSSDEGRVQMTAAAFAKGFLDLEGQLTPILATLVYKDEQASTMLDDSGRGESLTKEVKDRLKKLLNNKSYDDLSKPDVIELFAPTKTSNLVEALKIIENPIKCLGQVQESLIKICSCLRFYVDTEPDRSIHGSETVSLMYGRWHKLCISLYNSTKDQYDISKIPDIFDCTTYDLIHNSGLEDLNQLLKDLYPIIHSLENYVVVQEYGITAQEKYNLGMGLSADLWKKIHHDLDTCRTDLKRSRSSELLPTENYLQVPVQLHHDYAKGVKSPTRRVKTRLYFTSESLLHSILNVLRYAPNSIVKTEDGERTPPGLGYLTQVVFKMFENTHLSIEDPNRYVITIFYSDGVYGWKGSTNVPPNPLQILKENISLDEFVQFLPIFSQ